MLHEAQAGINIAGRNINNLRNANDTTFMADSKKELKNKQTEMNNTREGINSISETSEAEEQAEEPKIKLPTSAGS